MKKRQINDEMMDSVLKTTLSEYQEEEGRKILKEAEELNKTDEYAPTKQQIKEFEKISKKQLRKKKIKSLNFKLKVYRTATALGVLLLIFNISVVSVPAMKEKTLEFFMKTYNDHTDIGKYPGEKVEDVKNVSDDRFTIKLSKEYEITYLPEGFKLGDMSKDETGWEANYYNEDEVITFSQSSLNGTDLSIDTENTKNTYVDINGQQAFVTEKDEQISVTWRVDENIIRVTSIGVKKAELIKVAKSVEKVK
ncbi:DUF4367 domain-containing protein [Eubacterium ventriosum]|uniref:DUF4367 domain-containing protein n=1 Tax=Eubacterium ventriosum TaxID=39496 RepID=A0A413R6L5_9FIRM|nr:DUF4367 domain-containing protein [Eubacterium ventriosum]RHA17643.1 DUF4367 domain-containing protein [Eubacterium ventriosum]RHB16160.1 DUF4367 domain-containing protein [Eubacterium ventriosum]